jgi:FkbM family methyltransferase
VFRNAIGLSMRLYRASPFYPSWGKALARLLSVVSSGDRHTVTEVNGVKFDLDLREVIDSSLYFSGSCEPQAEKVIASVTRPGMVAIDIGANIGYHTFTLAKLVGPQGIVVAIEPTSYACEKLRRNLSLNDFANVRLMNVGLSDRDEGEVEARFRSSYRLDGRDEVRSERIRLVALDSLVGEQQLKRVDFIKLDVDGYEAKVFAGARTVLERFHPYIFFEYGPQGVRENGGDPEEVLHLLWRLGYHLRTENGQETPDVASVMRAVQSRDNLNLLAIPSTAA